MTKWGHQQINREEPTREQLKGYRKSLEAGTALVIFPEGTRGPGLREIKDLVAFLAYGKNYPVIPVGLKGTKVAEKEMWCLSARPKVSMYFGKPIYFPKTKGEDKKKAFAEFNTNLRESVNHLMHLDDIIAETKRNETIYSDS